MSGNTRLYVGLALVLVGLSWVARGLGLIQDSLMIPGPVWAILGAAGVFAGARMLLRHRRDSDRDRD